VSEFRNFEKLTVDVTDLPCGQFWLREDIYWYDTSGDAHYVPKGFISDGYSVPDFASSFVRGIKNKLPAYLHDWDYITQGTSRHQADNNIVRAMLSTSHGLWTVLKVRAGLWLGGWVVWNRSRKRLEKMGYDHAVARHMAATLEEAIEKASKL
jgi:hypothetical protein